VASRQPLPGQVGRRRWSGQRRGEARPRSGKDVERGPDAGGGLVVGRGPDRGVGSPVEVFAYPGGPRVVLQQVDDLGVGTGSRVGLEQADDELWLADQVTGQASDGHAGAG
jgi:hypothetical protein